MVYHFMLSIKPVGLICSNQLVYQYGQCPGKYNSYLLLSFGSPIWLNLNTLYRLVPKNFLIENGIFVRNQNH